MNPRIAFIVLDHQGDQYFSDLLQAINTFCPADVFWYDSGNVGRNVFTAPATRLAKSKFLGYAKEAPFFLDCFEELGNEYDYLVNLETDMSILNHGYPAFVANEVTAHGYDYMGPRLKVATPTTSRWYPYYSLRQELPALLAILDIGHTNAAFNPGQIFSRRYIETLLNAPFYGKLRDFVAANQHPSRSSSLPEVLMPTLAEAMGLPFGSYSALHSAYNRYRPYHSLRALKKGVDSGIHLIHPIRRESPHITREYIRKRIGELQEGSL